MILVKRTLSNGGAPILGLYITYHRREDAARCIATVDGAPSPGGGRELMRASYGTTKYCIAFLRGVSCSDNTCMNLHEWGDEKDCFTKEDLTTLSVPSGYFCGICSRNSIGNIPSRIRRTELVLRNVVMVSSLFARLHL